MMSVNENSYFLLPLCSFHLQRELDAFWKLLRNHLWAVPADARGRVSQRRLAAASIPAQHGISTRRIATCCGVSACCGVSSCRIPACRRVSSRLFTSSGRVPSCRLPASGRVTSSYRIATHCGA